MDIVKTLLAAALVLAAIAPVLMAGGACIAAFMMNREILKHLSLTVLCIAALVIAALAALRGEGQGVQLGAAALLAGVPWAVYLAGRRLLFKGP
jgi:hypothetical protein